MGSWRVAIGACAPLPVGVAADGRWQPPGVDDVEVLFVHGAEGSADGWRRDASLAQALAAAGWDRVDCYVADIAEYRPIARDARAVADRIVLTVGDWNVAGRLLWAARGLVDAVVCDHAGVEHVERIGHVAVPALVWGVQDGWTYVDPDAPRDIDVLFIGSTNPAIHAARNRWLLRLGALADRHRVVIRSRLFGPDYARHFARAKLVFNHSVRGEANIRSYEGPVAGACMLNERGNLELPLVATDGEHYASYDEHDLEQVIDGLLADEPRRLTLARAGQRQVRERTVTAHLARRIEDLRDRLAGRSPAARVDARHWDEFVDRQHGLCGREETWTAWRTQLDHDLVRAGSIDDVETRRQRREREHAAYVEAARRARIDDPADVLGLLDDARTPDALFLRASLLLRTGRVQDAIDDLRAVVHHTPLDAAAHVSLARALAMAGDRRAALDTLDAFIAALAPMPDLSGQRDAALLARTELHGVRRAWAFVEPHDSTRIAELLAWRVAHPGDADVLVIACQSLDGGPALAKAVQDSFAALELDDHELPDTEVHGSVAAGDLREVVAGAACVWAPPGSNPARRAHELGVPRLDLAPV